MDFEIIEDVCRKYAFNFTARDEKDQMVQLTFCHDIVSNISSGELKQIHDVIGSIPKTNDNLIRYFVAEGQEELILKAVRATYHKHANRGSDLGVKIAKSMCV